MATLFRGEGLSPLLPTPWQGLKCHCCLPAWKKEDVLRWAPAPKYSWRYGGRYWNPDSGPFTVARQLHQPNKPREYERDKVYRDDCVYFKAHSSPLNDKINPSTPTAYRPKPKTVLGDLLLKWRLHSKGWNKWGGIFLSSVQFVRYISATCRNIALVRYCTEKQQQAAPCSRTTQSWQGI